MKKNLIKKFKNLAMITKRKKNSMNNKKKVLSYYLGNIDGNSGKN